MRPIKLTVSAFGPYVEQQVLELNKLGESGLYLITGSTGAGKTSIFDAICYALYDKPSGEVRDESMLRSKYAPPTAETFVELEFVCGEKLYKVKRSPEYLRAKSRGEGVTKQPARAELILPDGSVIDKSKKEVTKAVEEIIGLDRNQFLQIAMISQGEFRKLLLADTEERKKIFRKIFKTFEYEKFQQLIKDEAINISSKYKSVWTEIATIIKSIEVLEDSEYFKELSDLKEGTPLAQDAMLLLEKIIEADENKNALLMQETAVLDKKIEQKGAVISKLEEFNKNLKSLIKAKEELKNAELNAEKVDKELNKVSKEYLEVELISKKITIIEKDLSEYFELENIFNEEDELKNNIIHFSALKDGAVIKEKERKEELEFLKERKLQLKDCGKLKEKTIAEKQKIEEENKQISLSGGELKSYLEKSEELKEKQKLYLGLSNKHVELSNKYTLLSDAFFDGQAGVLAQKLIIGAPCPVCGATEHPNLAVLKDEVPTEEAIKKAKNQVESVEKEKEDISKKCALILGEINALSNSLDEKLMCFGVENKDEQGLKLLREKFYKNQGELKELNSKIDNFDKEISELEGIEKRIPNIEAEIVEDTDQINLYAQKIASYVAIKSQKEEREKVLKEKLSFDCKEKAEQEIENLKTQKERLTSAYELAKANKDKLIDEQNRLKGEIKALEKVLEDKPNLDLQEQKDKKEELEQAKKAVQSQKEAVVSRLFTNRNALNNIKDSVQKSQSIEKKLKLVSSLSDTANGSLSGKEKISFEAYVQMSYFDRVLRRANLRLMKMTSGQYELVRRKDAVNMRSQSGLELDVIDHNNGSMRYVNTLSGGESFKASLSLALGLADEVQSSAGGVKLDTMFVDEGFGSLDADSLSLAVSTLQSLTEGNRLVGIISHVEELKNKIDKQIVVEKDMLIDGGSTFKIV